MPRWIWVRERGRTVRAEDAPDVCPVGHVAVQRPGWGPCSTCGSMGRTYTCDGCGAKSFDDEHRCPGPPDYEREIQRRGG